MQYVSLDAAQAQTSVRIRVPAWLPAGLELAGARAFAPTRSGARTPEVD